MIFCINLTIRSFVISNSCIFQIGIYNFFKSSVYIFYVFRRYYCKWYSMKVSVSVKRQHYAYCCWFLGIFTFCFCKMSLFIQIKKKYFQCVLHMVNVLYINYHRTYVNVINHIILPWSIHNGYSYTCLDDYKVSSLLEKSKQE